MGVGEGTWSISVRDVESGWYVSGWIISMRDLTGVAVLLQATCPVKENPFGAVVEKRSPRPGPSTANQMPVDGVRSTRPRPRVASWRVQAPRAIEAAWWDLAFDRARVIGTGLAVTTAVAELEHYIATNYNGLGLIHIPAYMAAFMGLSTQGAWITVGAEQADGGELRTTRGTPIVIGSGYPRVADEDGVGPAIMATGAVRLYMSEVTAIETFDRRTNLHSAVAERTIAAADD